jgi:hypothetical protein
MSPLCNELRREFQQKLFICLSFHYSNIALVDLEEYNKVKIKIWSTPCQPEAKISPHFLDIGNVFL